MDEMHIKENLVYDKHSGILGKLCNYKKGLSLCVGSIIGFTNLGEVNTHLEAFEQALGKVGEEAAEDGRVSVCGGILAGYHG